MIQWDDTALHVASDPPRRAERRAHQGWWRQHILGLPPGRDDRGILRNNLIPLAAVQSNPGLNFLDPATAQYVAKRVPIVLHEGGTLDEDRLLRNLLSSMPMCFNLLGPMRANPTTAAALLSTVCGLDISEIEDIEVEWTPPGAHPLGDRTAFDGWVTYRRRDGQRGFLGIETKYTEPFSQRAYDKPRYKLLTEHTDAGFKPDAASHLVHPSTNQLWRNSLLAVAIRNEGHYAEGRVCVIHLRDDPHVELAVDNFAQWHNSPPDLIRAISLEDIAHAAVRIPSFTAWSDAFTKRYLTLEKT